MDRVIRSDVASNGFNLASLTSGGDETDLGNPIEQTPARLVPDLKTNPMTNGQMAISQYVIQSRVEMDSCSGGLKEDLEDEILTRIQRYHRFDRIEAERRKTALGSPKGDHSESINRIIRMRYRVSVSTEKSLRFWLHVLSMQFCLFC